MESKGELKEIDIKKSSVLYYDDIIRSWDKDIDFSDPVLHEKLYKEKNENILIYGISYKT